VKTGTAEIAEFAEKGFLYDLGVLRG